MTIKRLSKKDKKKMGKLFHYCFFSVADGTDATDDDEYFNILDLNNCLGYFEKGELVSTYIIHNYRFFVRKILMNMGGIAGVTTQPEFRRKGQVKKLAIESLKLMRENKQFISVLYPFKFSYYRKFGYENCADIHSVIAPPSNILLPDNFKPLTVKELNQDEAFDILMPFREASKKCNLIIFDSFEVWKEHHLSKGCRIMAIYNGDILEGFFITKQEKREGPWNVRLLVTNELCVTEEAYLTMLDYIKKHTDQNKDFKLWIYGDELITDYFDDLWEGSFEYKISGGPMFRVVDVVEALKQLTFPSNLDFKFTLKIKDDMAPWNEVPLLVEISNGKVSIKKTTSNQYDLETDIKAFTQLFVGYRSIYDLERLWKVKINRKKIQLIDEAFPKIHTRLTTGF